MKSVVDYIKDRYQNNKTSLALEMTLIGYIVWTALTKHDQMSANAILIWNDLSWLFNTIFS